MDTHQNKRILYLIAQILIVIISVIYSIIEGFINGHNVTFTIIIAAIIASFLDVKKRGFDLSTEGVKEYLKSLIGEEQKNRGKCYHNIKWGNGYDPDAEYGQREYFQKKPAIINVRCQHCSEELKLYSREIINKKFMCPICDTENIIP